MSKNDILDYIYMILGTTLLACGINMFYNPNGIIVGGVSGLGILVEHISRRYMDIRIPIAATNIILNVPLFLIGWKFMGHKFFWRSAFTTAYLSLALTYTQVFPIYEGNLILVAVFGGVFVGSGLGLVFRGSATTGGTDIAASIIHRYKNHFSVSKLMFFMDGVIILLGFFVFGAEKTMYAIISVYISSKCIDAILEGMAFAKAAYIISEKSDEISKELISGLGRGVTSLSGRGMYTGETKDVLLCVFSQKEITKVKEIVKSVDKTAFIIVSDVKEVLGEGFDDLEK